MGIFWSGKLKSLTLSTASLIASVASTLSGIDLFFRVTGLAIIKSGRVKSDGLA